MSISDVADIQLNLLEGADASALGSLSAGDIEGIEEPEAAVHCHASFAGRCHQPGVLEILSFPFGIGRGGGGGRDALEGKGPRRRSQKRLGRRLEEVAKAVGGGYLRLQMPWKLALAVRGTVAGRRLGALEVTPPFQCIPGGWGGMP